MGSLNDGLSATGSQNNPPRPPVATSYQIGDPAFAKHITSNGASLVQNPTYFQYPLNGAAQYVFYKVVEFNPQGAASQIVDNIINGPQKWMEIGLQPTHGSVIDATYKSTTKASSAIMIEGVTGRAEIIRL
jgi:hypothetical protein